jgi:hypothetical protein
MDPIPTGPRNDKQYLGKHGPNHWRVEDQSFRSSFEQYVQFINGTGSYLLTSDAHFMPISDQCFSMRNDVVLRVEEMQEWYPELIRFLGIEESARKGWAEESVWNVGPQAECFYSGPNGDCDYWSVGVPSAKAEAQASSTAGGAKTMHATNAAGKLAEHYTPALAEMVTTIYASDLQMFNYPVWHGDMKAFPSGAKGELYNR